MKPPGELPWSKENIEINEDCLDMMKIAIQSLPDSDKKKILIANVNAIDEQVLAHQPDLAIVMLYSEHRKKKSCH